MTPEGKIKKLVTDMLKKHDAWYFSPAANGYGKSGIPDIIAIVNGKFVGIECKADRTKLPTTLQMQRAAEIRASGGAWFLVYDARTCDDVKTFIRITRGQPC